MSDEGVAALIRTHVQRYHAIDILDVYKMLHQGVFGPGHAVTSVKTAREWLEREGEIQVPNSQESLVENVHPEGQIVRVHLRPYLAAHGDLKKLLDGFIRSARVIEGNQETMARWWGVFQRMTERGGPLANRFAARTVSLIGRTRASENWPSCHHSPPFDRTYKPAYRVLERAIAEEMLRNQKIAFTVV